MFKLVHVKAVVLAVVLVGATALPGCFNPNVNIDSGGWTTASKDKQKTATDCAAGRLKKDGVDVGKYDSKAVSAKNPDDCWWVFFDAKLRDKQPKALPAHIAVFIDAAGQTTVFRVGQ